jgi:4'-phosphopantetheinyl transferase
MALYAFTLQREVGLDLEFMRHDFACEEIAARFFSEREVAMLSALPVSQRVQGFFNCWTRKEAYIKARGVGLSLPLNSFDVSLAPEEPAALLSVSDGTGETQRWRLQELNPAAGYVAAVAVEGIGWRLRCWQWS